MASFLPVGYHKLGTNIKQELCKLEKFTLKCKLFWKKKVKHVDKLAEFDLTNNANFKIKYTLHIRNHELY